MPMKTTAQATSGPIGANRATIPAAAPLTSLYKVSIGRAAVEDVLVRVVFRKFGGVRFEVFGGAAQQRPGLTAQAPLQLAQGLRACGLVGGGFGRDGAALPGADVEPRLEGDAREKRRRSRQIVGREAGMRAGEKFLVQPPPDDRDDVALFGRGDVALRDALRCEILPVGEAPARRPARG